MYQMEFGKSDEMSLMRLGFKVSIVFVLLTYLTFPFSLMKPASICDLFSINLLDKERSQTSSQQSTTDWDSAQQSTKY